MSLKNSLAFIYSVHFFYLVCVCTYKIRCACILMTNICKGVQTKSFIFEVFCEHIENEPH